MTTQVQVRLSDAELRELDGLTNDGSTRSDVLRAGLAALSRERDRRRVGQLYADEYARVPDTDDEMRIAEANLTALLDGDTW